jgi:uncharacterized protein (TIGR02453 family)
VSAYFTPAFFDFLRDLKSHNERDWFAANRDRYARDVEAPMLQFIADFAPRLKTISPAFVADKRRMGGSMFRIHRDTRFSPDKSPFKTWTAARFPHEARRKVTGVPAFYLHLGIDERFGGGGVYHIDMPQLTRVRRHIVESPKAWTSVRERVEIHGEQLKRAPAGFSASHEHIEDLKRQNLYTLTEFSTDDVVADNVMDRFVESCERAAPLVEFQTKALGLRW